jgi:hypothetical protein
MGECRCARVCVVVGDRIPAGHVLPLQVVFDKDRVVMSLPPIINGEHSKVCVFVYQVGPPPPLPCMVLPQSFRWCETQRLS